MSAIVECQTADEAVARFETHIKRTKDRVREMVNVVNIYIEEILKFTQVPQEPAITRMQFSEGTFPESVSHSPPGVFGKDVEAFGFAPDVENHEMFSDGGYTESEPFITFER